MGRVTICSFWWHDKAVADEERYQYGPTDVLIHKRMFARHLSLPHDYVCVTDRPDELDPSIDAVLLDRSTFVPHTRYAKLMLFRRDIGAVLGERILYSDLDVIAVDSLDPVVDRPEPLVLYRNANYGAPRRTRFNTSLIMLDAGCRPDIREAFDPKLSPSAMKGFGNATDQAWISAKVDKSNPYWDHTHGVWNAMRMSDKGVGVGVDLPHGARIVVFPGRRRPGMAKVKAKFPWVAEHYR